MCSVYADLLKNIKTLIGLKERKEKKTQYLIGSNKISTVSIGSNEGKKKLCANQKHNLNKNITDKHEFGIDLRKKKHKI